MENRGSLVVVGSGIKSVGHMTIEAKGWIEQSDVVLYCVADPVTEIWIKQRAKRHVDLYSLYGNTKKRIDTYADMTNMMVDHVRKGDVTCGVFYGHPGIFVLPSHRAIQICREEGYAATMLPAVSALDCLFADIGVDPSAVGSQTFEATDLLLRKRPIATNSHVVIWQIGCVGDMGFNFAGYDNRNLNILIDHLETVYRPDQPVIHYQGSQYPVCEPCVQRIRLADLRTAPVTGISTLYIGPATTRPTDRDMAVRLGLIKPSGAPAPAVAASDTPAAGDTNGSGPKPYAPTEAQRAVYARYMPAPDQSGLAAYLSEMMENPVVLGAFRRNPEVASRLFADLTDHERAALNSRHAGRIRMAVKIPQNSVTAQIHRLHFADRQAEQTQPDACIPTAEEFSVQTADVARRVLQDVAARLGAARQSLERQGLELVND